MSNNDNTSKKRGYTNKEGKFKEGNPGRPKGAKNYTTLLEEAIKDYETRTGKKLFDRLIQRAFINDNVLLNVVKKFIPDKTSAEVEQTGDMKFRVEYVNQDDKGD